MMVAMTAHTSPDLDHGWFADQVGELPADPALVGKSELDFLAGLLRDDLVRAIDALPDPFRTVVPHVYVRELSYREAAEALDVPLGTVRSRLARGRGLLQRTLWDNAREAGLRIGPPPSDEGTHKAETENARDDPPPATSRGTERVRHPAATRGHGRARTPNEGRHNNVDNGENHGPNAVETVLHALGSCLAVGFVYNAAAQGIEVRSLDFDLEGELDLHGFLGLKDDTRPGYQRIIVRCQVDTDASDEKIDELCRYVQRTSPVLDIISNPVQVTVGRK